MTDEPAAVPPRYRGGCAPGMRVGREGVPGCHASCLHRQLVEGYRDARHAWEALLESDAVVDVAGGAHSIVTGAQLTADELAVWVPRPTFKDWLIGHARGRHEDD